VAREAAAVSRAPPFFFPTFPALLFSIRLEQEDREGREEEAAATAFALHQQIRRQEKSVGEPESLRMTGRKRASGS
jgi:hypothetical protein